MEKIATAGKPRCGHDALSPLYRLADRFIPAPGMKFRRWDTGVGSGDPPAAIQIPTVSKRYGLAGLWPCRWVSPATWLEM